MRKARFPSAILTSGALAILMGASLPARADDLPDTPAHHAAWPALFMNAVTPAQSDAGYAYDVEVIDAEDPDWGALRYNVAYSGAGERSISLLQTPADADAEDLLEDLNDSKGDIWCDDFRDLVRDNVSLLEDRDDAAVFAFAASPDAADNKRERKLYEHTQVTVEVDKGDQKVRAFNYQLMEPIKPMAMAKVHTFELTGDCARGPEGRAYLSKLVTKVSGKAMAREFNQHTIQTFSNLTTIEN